MMSFESKVIDTTVEKLFGTTSCLVIKPLYEKGLFRNILAQHQNRGFRENSDDALASARFMVWILCGLLKPLLARHL